MTGTMRMTRKRWVLRTAILALGVVTFQGIAYAELPAGAQYIEAEACRVESDALAVVDRVHSSAGKHVTISAEGTNGGRKADVLQIPAPKMPGEHALWVRSAGVNLGLSAKEGEWAWLCTQTSHWAWHLLGSVDSAKSTDDLVIAVACPLDASLGVHAIDSVLITADASFKPSGIYASIVGPGDEASPEGTGSDLSSLDEVHVTITADPKGARVSPYIATANCHGLSRHMLGTPAWDAAMKRAFEGNLLVLLTGARKKPDEEGAYWDFASIDAFVKTAKEVWGVKELAFLPQLWLQDWDGKSYPSDQHAATSREILLQLAERYGTPGPLFIKYWMCSDEWPCGGYWHDNPKDFARFYSDQVHALKDASPDILVGGPVDCYPNNTIIRALLEECPELDFIAWNLFVCGRADYPLPQLFQRTASIETKVLESRKIAKEILGRELPVMVSSYGMNFRAWDPPDFRLAAPIGGVWNALALSHMTRGGAHSGAIYNVLAKDCGLFGPSDGFAVRAGVQSGALPKEEVNVRPMARVHDFFKQHIGGQAMSQVVLDRDDAGIHVLATHSAAEGHAVVIVNGSEAARRVSITLAPFERMPFAGYDLPTRYLYCDEGAVHSGKGVFFSPQGKAIFTMPRYSAWCLNLPCVQAE